MEPTKPAEPMGGRCEDEQVEGESCETSHRRARRNCHSGVPVLTTHGQTEPWTTRGQTEPLAALVAVTAVCLALSLYSGFLTGLVADLGSDREVGEVTVERIWHDVSENGVFDATNADLQTDIRDGTLPQGYYVAVSVTYVGDDGRLESAGSGAFGPDGTRLDDDTVPDTAERFERPIAIKLGPGDVQPGTFEVVVWG